MKQYLLMYAQWRKKEAALHLKPDDKVRRAVKVSNLIIH
jgi:hypothetical protein